MNRFLLTIIALITTLLSGCNESSSDDHAHHHEPVAETPMYQAAKAALATFSDQSNLIYEFQSEDQFKWHVYPKEDRIGRRYSEMTSEQKEATQALLNSALSEVGEEQIAAIMALEEVVRVMEGRDETDDFRQPEKYFLAFFGEPSLTDHWGWRFEGHHVSLNFSIIGEDVSVTPTAIGSNPGVVTSGPSEGLEILKEEQALARTLMKSFDEAQQAIALYDEEAPGELLTGFENKEMAPIKQGIGLPYLDMTTEQQQILEELLLMNMGKLEADLVDPQVSRMEAAGGLDSLRFIWMGGLERGDPHYYRIDGPTLVIEYDNVQNEANHIHIVWRDPDNDFGADYLKRHYETADHDHGHTH